MARELTVDEIMEILPTTVPRIAVLTEGLTPAQLRATPEPGAWSVNDVLAHLRASHDVLGGSMLRVVAEDRPRWRRLSPRAWMRKTDYPDWEFAPAFAAFSVQRAELLAVLTPLSSEAWDRTASVTEDRGVIERSVAFYGDWMAAHERVHLQQISETIAVVQENR
jgi:DinB superfamily